MSGPLYLYGILAEAAPRGALPPGIGGQDVSRLADRGIAVLCSPASPGPVQRTRRNMLCHTAVLEHAARDGTVLPLRFGTVAPDEAAARACLVGHHRSFAAALAALDGRIELGVKAIWAPGEAAAAVLRASPLLRAARDRLRARPEAETYYERIELGRQVEAAMDAMRVAETARLCAPLLALAERHAELPRADDNMIFNLAVLIDRTREPDFDAAVEALGARAGEGVTLRYVGPVPPFNFIDLRVDWSARDRAA